MTILLFFEAICRFEVACLAGSIVRYYSTLVNSRILSELPIDIEVAPEWEVDFEKEVKSLMTRGFDMKHMLDNVTLPEDGKEKQKPSRPRPTLNMKKPVIAAPHVCRARNVSLGQGAQLTVRIPTTRSIGLRPRMIVK
jgi:hypothetical protein